MVLKEQCITKFNQPNKNGRVYSSDDFDLNDPIIQEKLKNNSFFGELGFPVDRNDDIDLEKISHRVINLYKKDDGLYADIEILDTPNGRILEQLVNTGIRVGFRTRGSGTLNSKDDGTLDVSDFTLYTIDCTYNPA